MCFNNDDLSGEWKTTPITVHRNNFLLNINTSIQRNKTRVYHLITKNFKTYSFCFMWISGFSLNVINLDNVINFHFHINFTILLLAWCYMVTQFIVSFLLCSSSGGRTNPHHHHHQTALQLAPPVTPLPPTLTTTTTTIFLLFHQHHPIMQLGKEA